MFPPFFHKDCEQTARAPIPPETQDSPNRDFGAGKRHWAYLSIGDSATVLP
jgi:hypothetical protein